MMQKSLLAALSAALMAVSAISLANENETRPGEIEPLAPAVAINPASPATYMAFIDPASHKQYHDAMLNPAQWSQFVQPGFFMQMANPQVWTQWVNPASYQVMMNPNTYMHWMNPAAITREMNSVNPGVFINPANYQQFMQGHTYAAWWNPASYAGVTAPIGNGAGWFNMDAWTNPLQPALRQPADNSEG